MDQKIGLKEQLISIGIPQVGGNKGNGGLTGRFQQKLQARRKFIVSYINGVAADLAVTLQDSIGSKQFRYTVGIIKLWRREKEIPRIQDDRVPALLAHGVDSNKFPGQTAQGFFLSPAGIQLPVDTARDHQRSLALALAHQETAQAH